MISLAQESMSEFMRLARTAGVRIAEINAAKRGWRPKLDDVMRVAAMSGCVVLVEPNARVPGGAHARLVPDPSSRLE